MGLLDANKAAGHDPEAAARALDSMMLKQLLSASGAFKGSALAGSSVRSDLFVEALADAVAKSTDLGVGKLALPAPQAETAAATPGPAATPIARATPGSAAATPGSSAASLAPFTSIISQTATDGTEPGLASPLPDGSLEQTSAFGSRTDPLDGHQGNHRGVDLRAREGTPVLAAASGIVTRAGVKGGYGEVVEIDHGKGLKTVYAHAAALLVHQGQRVEQGSPIALVGSSGRSTGAHLHFEVRQEGKAVDPRAALKAYARRAEESTEGASPREGRYP